MRKRRLRKAPAELELTAFINLIVVLVPFLLSTAVFSRLAIMDVNLPGPGADVPVLKANDLQLEVVIRRDALEVGDRVGGLIQRIPRGANGEEFVALQTLMVQIKQRFPDKTEATVLAEPATPYDHLVQVMDNMRSTLSTGGGQAVRSELFPDLSIGDAPVRAQKGGA